MRRSNATDLAGVTNVRADLTNRGSLAALPRSLDAIVFCAGPSSPDERGYREIFIDGLGHLIEVLVAQETPPGRLVFTSSTAVYGQTGGEWVDETSPTLPRRFNGDVLLEVRPKKHRSLVRAG